jgi:hypothetical protein
LIIAAVAGAFATVLMPPAFYGEAVSETVTVLGFLMAAFVPAMALAATSIRAGTSSVQQIRSLGNAIKVQIKVFGGLFLYSLAACVILVLGKLCSWSLPSLPLYYGRWIAVNTSHLLPGIITFILSFLVLRSGTFIPGMLSILKLTTSLAEDEARLRDSRDEVEAENELADYQMPSRYGETLSH